ncbi:MAG: UTP--glucose-1-phosphate uridylyltransferase [Christensenellaceae bacterium]|jgi:UTP--glucose-1-phosphate uridylyltransferase|nr:UTP--glucose-1-phosphate uridylyltransferase [Christensenellaceae bacterium]
MGSIKKAVIPAAGYGTRFLPVTKAIPKEMLPIIDVPSLELIVDECVSAGIDQICFLLGRNKDSIPDYFDRNIEVECALKKDLTNEKQIMLDAMNKFADKVEFVYIRQPEMRGTGKAVELCKSFVGNDPFAVLFGDDVIYSPEYPAIGQLIDAYDKTKATIVGVQELPDNLATKCGVVVYSEKIGRYMKLKGFKEKPPIEDLCKYSRYASLGRFILTSDIFDSIEQTRPAKNGEIYLPVAIEILSQQKDVFAYDFEGKRYDIGDKLGFLKANIEYALRDSTLSSQMSKYIKDLVINGYCDVD